MKISRSEILTEMLEESNLERKPFETLFYSLYQIANKGDFFRGERSKDIFNMVYEGSTLVEISEKYELTKERVRQIFEKTVRLFIHDFVRQANEIKMIDEYKERIRVLEAENAIMRKDLDIKEYEFKLTPITECGFSIRALNCLRTAEIGTVEELKRTPSSELLKFRNFGRKSINEISNYMAKHNIEWR